MISIFTYGKLEYVPSFNDTNDNIDYTYITTFIKAQEKLSIKNVIDWKDKIINTSKKCI